MNNITEALLQDLQEEMDRIKILNSNIEVAWKLDKLIQNIKEARKLIIKEIEG